MLGTFTHEYCHVIEKGDGFTHDADMKKLQSKLLDKLTSKPGLFEEIKLIVDNYPEIMNVGYRDVIKKYCLLSLVIGSSLTNSLAFI
ncbi:MAG: hypothetical protein WC307_05565 [Candidatus Nanoarchaeia archaeon]|jgi:hypothetical protein